MIEKNFYLKKRNEKTGSYKVEIIISASEEISSMVW